MQNQTFNDYINSQVPTMVDFYADWCGPCKAMEPVIEKLKHEVGEKANILKVDVDKNPQAASAFGVRSIPTLILFQKGKVVWKQTGVLSVESLRQIIMEFAE
ncbi:MAG TPA: thioredoxin [Bacteroidia bacterium]|nr:thioredoxin [Bacteroidia bacterium]